MRLVGVRGVSKVFANGIKALADVSLDVQVGEFLSVLGPSRCGKSTAPRLRLMDEPFAALDEITRHRLNDDLLELWQRTGITVVFVTHSVFESVFLSQRIVVMAARPGRVATELAVTAPYPRNAAFRTSAEYAAWCRQASSRLGEAMAAP